MRLYAYSAINQLGRKIKGRLEAPNESELEQRLNRMQLELISAADISWRQRLNPIARRGAGRRELIIFCFHLELLARAGVPLIDGLCDLRDSADDPAFRGLVANLIDDIQAGSQLSQALAKHGQVFDPVFVNLVGAGEVSGRLPDVLGKLGEMLKWQDELAAQSKKIVLYPAFVASVVIGVVAFLMVYLVPQLVSFIRNLGQELPLHTRLLLTLSALIIAYGWLLIVLPPIVLVSLSVRARTDRRLRLFLDRCKLRLWIVGPILHSIMLSRFTHFFALLYDSGIPIVQALKVSEGVMGNTALAADIARVHESIIEGQGLTSSFQRVGLFSPLALRVIRIGESSGSLDSALQTVSYFYGRDVHESIARLQSLIEPVLTLILGLVLAWIMLSVLGPIYDIITRIKL